MSEHLFNCVECGCRTEPGQVGWRAYRVDDPELDEPPTLAFYCPSCAQAEFSAKPSPRLQR
jgi:hypothetical protein